VSNGQVNAGVLMIKGAVAEMAPEEQERVAAAADAIRAVCQQYGDEGQIALTLVTMEMARDGTT
jgi:hypothetical protein